MKDMSEASYILGIRLYRDRVMKFTGLSQSTCIYKILERYGFTNCKAVNVPFEYGIHLSKKMAPQFEEETVRMSNLLYTSCIGSIMYDILCASPDIIFGVSVNS